MQPRPTPSATGDLDLELELAQLKRRLKGTTEAAAAKTVAISNWVAVWELELAEEQRRKDLAERWWCTLRAMHYDLREVLEEGGGV